MCLLWFQKNPIELAAAGGKKILASLQNFLKESELINEIYDRADKELFFPAASSKEYRYIEDINENDIYDQFIDFCFNGQTLGIDVKSFVDTHYPRKSKKAKQYITDFFRNLSLIIFNVLKEHSSPETKIILKGQEIGFSEISTKLNSLENRLIENSNPPTTVVTYCANMQNTRWDIKNHETALTHKRIIRTIPLTLSNSILSQQNGDIFWDLEKDSLIKNFSQKVTPLLEEGGSFSVFGLAPIPLLILYGNQFANRANIDIYQLHKNPSTWNWGKPEKSLNIKETWLNTAASNNEAVMILSFSGAVNIDNVNNAIDTNSVPTVELSLETPYDDFLQNKLQLEEFLTAYRKAKSKLLDLGVKKIHLFAAIPLSFAIGIGQIYNPNYDACLVAYDYNQGVYTKALTIGEST